MLQAITFRNKVTSQQTGGFCSLSSKNNPLTSESNSLHNTQITPHHSTFLSLSYFFQLELIKTQVYMLTEVCSKALENKCKTLINLILVFISLEPAHPFSAQYLTGAPRLCAGFSMTVTVLSVWFKGVSSS